VFSVVFIQLLHLINKTSASPDVLLSLMNIVSAPGPLKVSYPLNSTITITVETVTISLQKESLLMNIAAVIVSNSASVHEAPIITSIDL